jgi:hypothetical protein
MKILFFGALLSLSSVAAAGEIPTEQTTNVTGLITRQGTNLVLSNSDDLIVYNGRRYPVKGVWVWPVYTDGKKVRGAAVTNTPVTLHGRFEWKGSPTNHMIFVEEG